QVERNHQQHDATEAQGNRRSLPGNRPLAANQPMSRNYSQRMKRMIDRANQAVLPVSSIDLLCLADVPQPVGKTGLGVAEPPAHQTGRHRHQETDPDCMLKRRHDGPSNRWQSAGPDNTYFRVEAARPPTCPTSDGIT